MGKLGKNSTDKLGIFYLSSICLFIGLITFYHLFGIKGNPICNIIWTSSHHLIITVMGVYIYITSYDKLVRMITSLIIIYFLFKLFYLTVTKLNLFYLSENLCSIICVLLLITGLILFNYGGKIQKRLAQLCGKFVNFFNSNICRF